MKYAISSHLNYNLYSCDVYTENYAALDETLNFSGVR